MVIGLGAFWRPVVTVAAAALAGRAAALVGCGWRTDGRRQGHVLYARPAR
ncbi:hypothetical protein HBB16_21265 [Pseudonocardia sp. MCCB 268]|nr:hypothetical protein [Pseudonocardia cytotoxica]